MVILIVLMLAAPILVIAAICSAYEEKKYDYHGHQNWTQAQSNYDARYRQIAQEYDAYYTGSTISGINGDFYSDGSLKYDPATKKSYPKGQYYCRSDGMTANYQQAGANVPRPPK